MGRMRPESWYRGDHWSTFLFEVADQCPVVLQDLRTNVLPIYIDAFPNVENTYILSQGWLSLLSYTDEGRNPQLGSEAIQDLLEVSPNRSRSHLEKALGGAIKLREALEKWAEDYHIASETTYESALETLDWWREHPEAKTYWVGIFGQKAEWIPDIPPLVVEAHWRFSIEPLQDFKNRAKRDLEKALETYCEETKLTLEEEGWTENAKKKLKEHAVWLAYRQCLGWSHKQIAKHCKLNPKGLRRIDNTIRDAQEVLASSLGLKLRELAKGRPKN